MNIAWIGLGAMGLPMAAVAGRAGFSLTTYDPNPNARLDVECGAVTCGSPAEAARDAEVVVLMVATPEQALDAIEAIGAELAPGTRVVVMATIGPAATQKLAALLKSRDAVLVDAPVSGGIVRAARGELLIMASGAPEDLVAVRPLLDALGSDVVEVGPAAGDGQRMKLVNQLLCGVHIVAAAEALSFAERIGIPRARALEVVEGGAAASFMLSDRGRRMVEEQFSPARSAIDIFVKDLGLVTSEADLLGLPLASAARDRFEDARAAGNGRLDDSSVILTYTTSNEPERSLE